MEDKSGMARYRGYRRLVKTGVHKTLFCHLLSYLIVLRKEQLLDEEICRGSRARVTSWKFFSSKVEVGRVKPTGRRSHQPGCRDYRALNCNSFQFSAQRLKPGRPSESYNWCIERLSLPTYFLILTPTSPGILRLAEDGCDVNLLVPDPMKVAVIRNVKV